MWSGDCFKSIIFALLSVLITSCGNKAGTISIDSKCEIDDAKIRITSNIFNGGAASAYFIDPESAGLSQVNGRVYVFLGRQKKSETTHYNVFVPPQNIEIKGGSGISHDLSIELVDFWVSERNIKDIYISLMISNNDLFNGKANVNPDEYFKAIEKESKFYLVPCTLREGAGLAL